MSAIREEAKAIPGQHEQPAKEIEAIIAQVQGVISSRVVCQGKEITEIHVLADASRSPKQVVRDIESAALVKLGLSIDHKRISIAQLGQEEKQLVLAGPRLKLVEIGYVAGSHKITVTATVVMGNEQFKGTASGPNTTRNRLSMVARATLAAVEKCYGVIARLNVDEVHKVELSGQEIVIVSVSHYLNFREEALLGTALVRDDALEATAKATLDAINRRLVMINHE